MQELPVTGYLDRFSRRPGESLAAQVSVPSGQPCRARLVRVISGDPNPAGPGLRFEDLSARFDISFPGRPQPIQAGSCAVVPTGPRRPAGATTWTVLVWAAALPAGTAALLSEETDGTRVTLGLGPQGAVARLTHGGTVREVPAGTPLKARGWYRLWLSLAPEQDALWLGQQPLLPADGAATVARAALEGFTPPAGGGAVVIGAEDARQPARHVTAKLEEPAILPGAFASWPVPLGLPAPPLARWDFSRGIPTQRIEDTGPQACHGELRNLPTRAVVGARWSGREMCWRHAPEDYAAIHFHADDLGDCGWQTDFRFDIPQDLRSGAYALHLTCEAGEDWLPFYVLPPRGTATAPIAFLASTFTYQAYANHARGNADEAYMQRVREWGAYPHNPDHHPLYGRSTYNRHPDDSGIAFSSRLRPILTMRPGFLTFNDARGSGLRHYPADTHILAWLEARGFAFDVITDEDLHEEGAALLAPYALVMTGSHPEYHTAATLDALRDYTATGGRLTYLGGNGFYWRIACVPELPGMIELRRAEGGIRAWAAEPGEYYHALDGQYGGLWRRNRRPPQALVGVGFSGQGLFEGTHYRRLPASHAPEFAWMFEGIAEEVLGDYGLSGGGAAGFELDRADTTLGTPPEAVVLARSEEPPASFVTVPEELLSHVNTVSGETPEALKRGEIVYFDTPGGGAVFSVGSITFCGSLWRNGFEGPVSRLLENVVRRFSRITR
ncbi:N,N-dimethylformamidase large subunit [Roseomonas sp. E05]|uniref:N,N-dimethylformamidase beta subunit family domain-containing protein n=1 Tax=Roseomonas sp. E05 TaxID=3046310 RepID=UPI0024BA14F3|nr:N,N-dimethylformamidase beta subunit family domain-containing protein [Roseomonas sp. E05]MDJ0388512.1 N,N-dimethylformamidase large subunit [Roseomonas sp. E05]